MPKLKVYRTAIGFHDAYVAAPSMKAALEAWGAGGNLFATGMAEIVTDANLTRAPLAQPGEVVKVKRGTDAEHFEALGKAPAKARSREAAADKPRVATPETTKPVKPKPRPSRAKLDSAEAALAGAETRHRKAMAALVKKEAALRQERRRLEAAQDAERAKLQTAVDRADAAYAESIKRWRG